MDFCNASTDHTLKILDDGDYAPDWVRFEHIARRVRALYTRGDGDLNDDNDVTELRAMGFDLSQRKS